MLPIVLSSLSNHPIMSDSPLPQGLQHAWPPCSSPPPEVCPSSGQLHQRCHPAISSSVALFSFCLQSFPASGFFFFSPSEWPVLIRLSKYWSFSFSMSPSNENSGFISFKMDWIGLLAVQGTLRSLLQHHSSKASILQCSALFMVQLSQLNVMTGKTIALTTWTFVSKVLSLLFNTLSTLVIAFLPGSNGLLISRLQLPYYQSAHKRQRWANMEVFILFCGILF